MLKWIYTIEMPSNYHAAKSFTLTQPLACGVVALKKFDHNQFISKYDHTYDKFSFDSHHYLFQSNPSRFLDLNNQLRGKINSSR